MRYPDNEADYTVRLNMFDRGAEHTDTKLEYRIHSNPVTTCFNGNSIIHTERHGVNLNSAKIHEPLSEISLISGEILNDLKMEVTSSGEIVKIKNLKEIHKRWNENIRFRLERTYTGEVTEAILAHMDKQIHNEQAFIRSLKRDPFLFFYIYAINRVTDEIPVYWLARFPVIFDRTVTYSNDKRTAKLQLNIRDDQVRKLREHYASIYGNGIMDMKKDIAYSLEDGCMDSVEVLFEIMWNSLRVKGFNMEIKHI